MDNSKVCTPGPPRAAKFGRNAPHVRLHRLGLHFLIPALCCALCAAGETPAIKLPDITFHYFRSASPAAMTTIFRLQPSSTAFPPLQLGPAAPLVFGRVAPAAASYVGQITRLLPVEASTWLLMWRSDEEIARLPHSVLVELLARERARRRLVDLLGD